MRLFAAAFTQWHVSHNGPVGLRYEALPVLREAHGIPPADWPQMLDDLQTLERTALEHWREQRGSKR